MLWARRISVITLIRYTRNQKIGKPNNKKKSLYIILSLCKYMTSYDNIIFTQIYDVTLLYIYVKVFAHRTIQFNHTAFYCSAYIKPGK